MQYDRLSQQQLSFLLVFLLLLHATFYHYIIDIFSSRGYKYVFSKVLFCSEVSCYTAFQGYVRTGITGFCLTQ